MLITISRVIKESSLTNIIMTIMLLVLKLAELLSYPLLFIALVFSPGNRILFAAFLALYLVLPKINSSADNLLLALGNDNRMEKIKQSFSRCVNIDFEFFESEKGQEMFSKAVATTNSSKSAFSLLYQKLIKQISAVLYILISLFFVFSTQNRALSLSYAVFLFLVILVFFFFEMARGKKKSMFKKDENSLMRNIRYLEKISRIRESAEVLDYYSAEDYIKDKFSEQEFAYDEKQKKYMKDTSILVLSEYIISFLLCIFALLSDAPAANAVMLFSLLYQGIKTAEIFSASTSEIAVISRQIENYYAFIDWGCDKKKENLEQMLKSISFKNVSFSYDSAKDKKVLKNISLEISADEKIGIVGLNGAGKTTLIKLLIGLYDAKEGSVSINGRIVSEIANVFDFFSCIFQDDTVLPMSVRENILFGRKMDEKKYRAVLEKSGLDKILEKKKVSDSVEIPSFYVKNGTDFSLGEIQHLYLARALYKDAPFFIMDEPTAALDPVEEAKLFSSFNSLLEDKGGIFITHRCSSLKGFKRILVIADGEIVEDGSYDELIKKGGYYASLLSEQAALFSR